MPSVSCNLCAGGGFEMLWKWPKYNRDRMWANAAGQMVLMNLLKAVLPQTFNLLFSFFFFLQYLQSMIKWAMSVFLTVYCTSPWGQAWGSADSTLPGLNSWPSHPNTAPVFSELINDRKISSNPRGSGNYPLLCPWSSLSAEPIHSTPEPSRNLSPLCGCGSCSPHLLARPNSKNLAICLPTPPPRSHPQVVDCQPF